MKKKILCLSLAVLMIAASFVGCGKKDKATFMIEQGMENSKEAVTITMYVLAESKVHADQEARVENAANLILDPYKIKLDLKYFTEDEYYTTLETNLAEMKAHSGETRETEAPVYTDENGIPKTYYPPNEEYQVDVFYFSGYDRYKKYSSEGYLADFSKELTENATELKDGISSVLYESVNTVNGKYDMMPVNTAVGEYTYMLVSKEILKSENLSTDNVGTLVSSSCADLLASVKKYYPDYVPLYSSEGVLAFDDVKFFGTAANGYASDEFSILAGTYNDSWTYGKKNEYPVMSGINATVENGNPTVIEQIKRLKSYEFNGYYPTDDNMDKPFAVGYFKGTSEIVDKYSEDYEVVVLDTPTLTTEALYENVIALSKENTSLKASARVLSELYTNEELINVLAHGVEGENYIDATPAGSTAKVIKPQAKDERFVYDIDINKVANTSKVYPTVDEDPARCERIRSQNADAKADLLLGYTLYGSSKLDAMKSINEYSAAAYAKILAAKNEAELDAVLADIAKTVEGDDVKKIFAGGGVYDEYMKWLTANKIYVTEEKK
ncbi:MAG: hypothetical protein J6U68_01325 [Clostridia bacterium]|nr:hypothetical protein [Clostridia bacterium]